MDGAELFCLPEVPTAVSPESSPIQNDGKIPAARGKCTSPLLDEAETDGIDDAPLGDIGTRHLSRSFVLLRSLRSDDVVMMNASATMRGIGRGDGYVISILSGRHCCGVLQPTAGSGQWLNVGPQYYP